MTVGKVSVNVEQITKNLNDAKALMEQQKNDVQSLFDNVTSSISTIDADYKDDNSINGTAGHDLVTSDVTMAKVNDMEYDEIVKLLSDNADGSQLYAELQAQQESLNNYLTQFNNLKATIDSLGEDLSQKLQALNDAVSAQEKAQKEANDAQANLEEMQQEYNNAIAEQDSDLAQKQALAYQEAMAEYLAQDDKDESKKLTFQEIYKEKTKSISIGSVIAESAKANLEEAQSAFNNAKRTLTSKNAVLNEAQLLYNNTKTKFDEKEEALNNTTKNIQSIQTNVANLEKKIATFNFVQTNKTAIEDVAYEKNPVTIQARADIDAANTTIANKLAEATTAEAAAQAAAKDGNEDLAKTEKAKAETAKQAAAEEQRKADAAKAKLRATDAKQAVVGTITSNMAAIDSKLTSIDSAIASAGLIKQAHTDIAAATTTVNTQLGLTQAAEAAAKAAVAKGDLTTAAAEKEKAENARKAAEAAQQAAQAAAAQLEAQQANDKKSVELAAINSTVATIKNLESSAIQQAGNLEAAATRESTGVSYANSVDEVTGESYKDYNKMDLTKMMSQNELDLVSKNNLDLTELVQVGNELWPRFVIAKGKSDGKYHIYEREFKNGKPTSTLTSLARKYIPGGQSKSYYIVPNGNGYMSVSGESQTAKNNYSEVFLITDLSKGLCNAEFCNTFKKYSTYSPLSLDLNGDGVKTSDKVVDFDIDGDGQMDKINDSADAVLVFDKNKDGVAGADGSECFGNNTDLDGDGKADGYKDGFEALKALAMKENLVNGKDDNVLDEKDLKFLEMSYGLKLKAEGYNSEAQSLGKFGITQINLAATGETTMMDNFDGKGNQLMTQEGATFVQNGETKEYADIWHKKLPFLNATQA